MKRSDMIGVLEGIINNVYELSVAETELFANEILDGIEKAGMLPPPICDCKSSVCYENTINEWESEND